MVIKIGMLDKEMCQDWKFFQTPQGGGLQQPVEPQPKLLAAVAMCSPLVFVSTLAQKSRLD